MNEHQHTCGNCGHSWDCQDVDKKGKLKPFARCLTTLAAKTNGQGPFCLLCFHLNWAQMYAFHRDHARAAKLCAQALKSIERKT